MFFGAQQAYKQELDALKTELDEAHKLIDELKKRGSKLEGKLEKVKKKSKMEIEQLKSETEALTLIRDTVHEEEIGTVRKMLAKVEQTAGMQEQRATVQILEAHKRLDEALKLGAERLAAKRKVEQELEKVRRELLAAKLVDERRDGSDADTVEDLRQQLAVTSREVEALHAELAECRATIKATKRLTVDASSAHQVEKHARIRLEEELQQVRSELEEERSASNRRGVAIAAAPRISSALAEQRRAEVLRRTQAAADIEAQMEAAESHALS
jgi:chromosome segregation ATPase